MSRAPKSSPRSSPEPPPPPDDGNGLVDWDTIDEGHLDPDDGEP